MGARGRLAGALLALLTTSCVVPPPAPGVVEPGAAIRMRFDPAVEVREVGGQTTEQVTRLMGRVRDLRPDTILLLVNSGQRANGRSANALEGLVVAVPMTPEPEIEIITGDATSSDAATLGVVGVVVVGVLSLIHYLYAGGGGGT